MLARQRQEYILEQVSATGGVRVAEVVAALGISEMTVRRDITELVAQGLVERVHGGAVAASPTSMARPPPPSCDRGTPWPCRRAPPLWPWPRP